MAKKKKSGIEFSEFETLAAEFEKLGGDVKKIAEECLAVVPEMINPNLQKDMQRHKRTGKRAGKTSESIVKNAKAEWQGNIGKMPVGFDLKKGGMPSIFLMYGSPRHAPKNQYGAAKSPDAQDNPGFDADKKLYNDIYGTAIKRKIGEAQEKILTDAIKKRLGG
jgi:hypothetical protein